MTGSYAVCQGQFSTHGALERMSHIWHETYSLPYTRYLDALPVAVGSHQKDWELVQESVHGAM